jgi:hypothetical protein
MDNSPMNSPKDDSHVPMVEHTVQLDDDMMTTESPNVQTKDRSNTVAIIQKFTSDEGQVDVRQMAHKMNVINKQNFTLKKILVLGSLFLVVAVGLMIASNIIGGIALKDMKVKDNQLVTKGGVPIDTGLKLYNLQVNLFSKPDVLNGIQYIYVPVTVDGLNSTLNLKVNSYIFTEGNQIFFLGDKYTLILKRTSYELVSSANLDPLDLNSVQTAKRVFKSHEDDEIEHKNIHPPNRESSNKRDEGDELNYTIANLDARGTIASPASTRASTPVTLKYYGGTVVTNGTVVIIVWNYGNLKATNVTQCFNNLPTFYDDLLDTKLFTTYTPGKKGSDKQSKVVGVDKVIHYLTPDSSRQKTSLSDQDIKDQLASWLSKTYDPKNPNGSIPKDTKNPLNYMYMIHFPSTINLNSGFCSSYCGFHSTVTTNSVKYIYAALPWNGDCVGGCTKTGYTATIGGGYCGAHLSVASHELTEMATDPYFSAYYDVNGYENADKCAWTSPACFSNGANKYCVQQAWNHAPNSAGNDIGCTNVF